MQPIYKLQAKIGFCGRLLLKIKKKTFHKISYHISSFAPYLLLAQEMKNMRVGSNKKNKFTRKENFGKWTAHEIPFTFLYFSLFF